MNKMIIILLLLYCTSLFSLGTTTEINSSNTIKEINFLKKQVKQMQLKINKVEWKRENSIDNINNRIESFGNYLEISSNRNEIIIAFFGILMTVLVIYFGLKNTKEAKLVAKEEAENAMDKWIEKEAKFLIEKTQKKISKEITAKYLKEAKKENDKQILALLESYESKILLQEDDIELSLHSKEQLKEEARRVKLKSIHDRNFNDWLKLIFFAIAYKDYALASNYIDNIMNNNKLSKLQLSRIFYLKGFIADKELDEKNTIKFYEKAIELSPKFIEPYRRLGSFYSNVKKDYKKAIKLFKKIKKLNPFDHKAHNSIGVAYRRLGDYEKAEKYYLKSIELNPDDRKPYNNIGYLYAIKKDYEKAIANYKKAIQIDPDSSIASYNNIFRIQLITKNKFDEELEKVYLKKFEGKGLDSFANYELYKILYFISLGQPASQFLQKWKDKYGHTIYRQFFFDEIIVWANKKDDTIKEELLKAINFFKKYYA